MQIRIARSPDYPTLAAMRYEFRASLGTPNKACDAFECRMLQWLDAHLGKAWTAWVATEDESLIGHVFLHVIDKVPNPVPEPEQLGYITNLYVREQNRGTGIGGALLDTALQECRGLQVDTVVLWPSPRSRSLYDRRGFASPAAVLELPFSRDLIG
jgi:GNAT superfamily N-acetyltransferase